MGSALSQLDKKSEESVQYCKAQKVECMGFRRRADDLMKDKILRRSSYGAVAVASLEMEDYFQFRESSLSYRDGEVPCQPSRQGSG